MRQSNTYFIFILKNYFWAKENRLYICAFTFFLFFRSKHLMFFSTKIETLFRKMTPITKFQQQVKVTLVFPW